MPYREDGAARRNGGRVAALHEVLALQKRYHRVTVREDDPTGKMAPPAAIAVA